MEQPDITVTMPAYNRADLIGRAIESVQAQSLRSWELVIVDDGSTDATLEIAYAFAQRDARIKVFRNETNLGIGKTRNHALRRSSGRFITPLDSDDWMQPVRLERLLSAADAHRADLLADDLLIIRDGDETPMATLSEVCHEPLLDTLVIDMAGLLRRLGFERDGMAVGLTKPLIRRQFLIDHGIEYDTTLHVVEDYWMLADCVAAGAKFVIIPEAHYYYRLHPQQSTTVAGSPRDITSTKARLQAFLDSPLAFVEPEAANFARYHIQRMEVLASYAVFSDALKRRHVGRALGEAVRHPRVVGEFAARLPYAIERRRRSRLGDPFAFDPLSSGHRTRPMPTRLSR